MLGFRSFYDVLTIASHFLVLDQSHFRDLYKSVLLLFSFGPGPWQIFAAQEFTRETAFPIPFFVNSPATGYDLHKIVGSWSAIQNIIVQGFLGIKSRALVEVCGSRKCWAAPRVQQSCWVTLLKDFVFCLKLPVW